MYFTGKTRVWCISSYCCCAFLFLELGRLICAVQVYICFWFNALNLPTSLNCFNCLTGCPIFEALEIAAYLLAEHKHA